MKSKMTSVLRLGLALVLFVALGHDATSVSGKENDVITEIMSNSVERRTVVRNKSVTPERVTHVRRTSGGLTYAEKAEFIQVHNDKRSVVYPTASDMKFMVWDEQLADMAQEWAERCVFEHGQPNRHNPPYSGTIGQNLYASTANPSPTDGVTAWDDEVQYYTYSTGTCTDVCGHYTQVVWADSDHVGCGIAFCDYLQGFVQNAYNFVCNYGPAGNWIGQRPYTQGSSCSACPQGYPNCDNNLCSEYSNAPGPDCGSKTCDNGGTLDQAVCECQCADGFSGNTCGTTGSDGGEGGSGDGGGGDGGYITEANWLKFAKLLFKILAGE